MNIPFDVSIPYRGMNWTQNIVYPLGCSLTFSPSEHTVWHLPLSYHGTKAVRFMLVFGERWPNRSPHRFPDVAVGQGKVVHIFTAPSWKGMDLIGWRRSIIKRRIPERCWWLLAIVVVVLCNFCWPIVSSLGWWEPSLVVGRGRRFEHIWATFASCN